MPQAGLLLASRSCSRTLTIDFNFIKFVQLIKVLTTEATPPDKVQGLYIYTYVYNIFLRGPVLASSEPCLKL